MTRPMREPTGTALGEMRLATVYQPIADLHEGRHLGYEALARPVPPTAWRSPQDLFDPSGDDAARLRLEGRALRGALCGAAALPADALVFVNCSPAAVLAGVAIEALRDTPEIDPRRVVIEITEGRAGADHAELARQIAPLRRLGCAIAIDDVGSGASGINRVVALRPDWIKIDRDLVHGIDTDDVRQNAVRMLLHIARSVGARVVIEGIERDPELEAVLRLGARYAQGFLLGRPARQASGLAPQIAARLEAWRARPSPSGVEDPRRRPIAALAEPPVVIDVEQDVRSAAAVLLRIVDAPGCVAVEDGEPQAWLSRGDLLAASRGPRGGQRVASLVEPGFRVVPPQTPVAQAMRLASDRGDARQAEPLVVWAPGAAVGVVPVGRLLGEAARLVGSASLRPAPSTGLPGRLEAEAHVRSMMRECELARWGAVGARLRHDAAFAQLHGLERAGERCGWQVADELAHQAAALLRTRVLAADPDGFVAELESGRFLATARPAALAAALDGAARAFEPLARQITGDQARVTLNAHHLADIVRRIETPAELFALDAETLDPQRRAA